MQEHFIEYIILIIIILALVMIASKLRLAYHIVLVLGGLALSFTSVFSNLAIDPEMVFFIFLPPLLYEAAWQISWKEFWKFRRVIFSFAFPVVIITSCVIAVVADALIPGFTLALGFLLGGIISPPDAISATTIMRQVKVPKTMVSVAEGESLLNDASSLVVFRFALAAVITGQFHFKDAAVSFLLVIVMGIIIGVAVAFVFYAIHRWLPTTTSIEIILTLVTPYSMYYLAEHFHFSGVLAVVSGGLLLSSKRNSMLNYKSRIQGVNVWNNFVFLLNGLVFLLIGLQLPFLTSDLGMSIGHAIGYGLAISAVLILSRLACAMGASVFTKVMSRFITVADANPGWKGPLVLGWAGMRGVVSLAAALSIPVLINEGHPFPYRNLILFITFIVILVTLVFQGLTLPWLIRKVKLVERFNIMSEHEQEALIQKNIAATSLKFIEEKYGDDRPGNEHLNNLRTRLMLDLAFYDRDIEEIKTDEHTLKRFQLIYLEMLEQQRTSLNKLNRSADYDEELIRKYQAIIDLEEMKVREKFLVKRTP